MSVRHYLACQDLNGDFPHPNVHKHHACPCARPWFRLPMRSRLSVAAPSQPGLPRKSRSPADRTSRLRDGQPRRYATCRNSGRPDPSPYRDSTRRSAPNVHRRKRLVANRRIAVLRIAPDLSSELYSRHLCRALTRMVLLHVALWVAGEFGCAAAARVPRVDPGVPSWPPELEPRRGCRRSGA